MKRFLPTLTAGLVALALLAPSAQASFGLEKFDITFTEQDGSPATQAGSHPFQLTTTINFNKIGSEDPDGSFKGGVIEQIVGLVADTGAPSCSTADFLTVDIIGASQCSDSTALGAAAVQTKQITAYAPIFNLDPSPGTIFKLGFIAFNTPITVEIGLKDHQPFNPLALVNSIPQTDGVLKSVLYIWGNPADPAHDPYRGRCVFHNGLGAPPAVEFPELPSFGECQTSAPEVPFLTLPRSCRGPLASVYAIESWQHPGARLPNGEPDLADPNWVSGQSLTHDDAEPPNPLGMTGCAKLGFSPQTEAKASTDQAESGSGLDFNIDFHNEGLTSPSGIAQSEMKKVVVTLPKGMTINPSIAEGLGVCSPAQLAKETAFSAPGQGCPEASKIGTAHVETPLLGEPIEGSLFLATQDDPATTTPGAENPFDNLISFYIILKKPSLGLIVKLPARVEPDEQTGQLIATSDDIPELPFSHLNLHLREGVHSPLISPPTCGTYTTKAVFTPRARPSETLTTTSSFNVNSGVGGGPCPPGGVAPFKPSFEAGSINNNAKAYSPFYMRLIRHDGEQDMTKFSVVLPPGVIGKLAGLSKCPDAAIADTASKTARAELAAPSCPASSKIGHTLAGAGVGGGLVYVPGSIYLGGPYKGDPLSVIAITPALAGPFDGGTVVVREALTLNPETAEVEVDGNNSDPIPHILNGIPLKLRDLRAYVDRPQFIINPTNCAKSSARATLFGSYLSIFDPSDDVPVGLASPYQAADCASLPFKPKLSLKLKGGTKRGDHPALRAVYNAKPNEANVGSVVVTLAKSAFLDQAHIRTICTRVQFAAKACPKGAEYGYARAFTPLLDEPLEGPVYLRSSNHKLPDLVAALHGIVDVNVVSRIDSYKGGIRSSFETVPDAPVSKFVLTMQGGKKGLIVNSRNLCSRNSRADVRLFGHNGKPYNFKSPLKPQCGKKGRNK